MDNVSVTLTPEQVRDIRNMINQAVSDFRWLQEKVPDTDFQSSIVGLEYALDQLEPLP